jgi:hypothetical protein
MGIYIFTKKESALKTVFPKNTEFVTGTMSKHNPDTEDFSYIDVSGFSAADIKKNLTQLKKSCKGAPWGIIDPKGSLKDPASLFFDGASDYLGPDFFKGSSRIIDQKRLKAASQWRSAVPGKTEEKSAKRHVSSLSSGLPKTGIKIPSASMFPGWKKMQTGKTMPFYLVYCAIHGKMALNTRLGEKAYGYIQQRLLTFLFQSFNEGDGLAWMDTGKDFLFLLPAKIKNVEAVVKACVKMLASAPLIAIEVLGLTIPVNFVFALHYGPIRYSPPGATGKVVSDAVNFVFHLGSKKAEPGRLIISDELPDGTIPQALEDCFISSGEFEGRKTWHTKKFGYNKPWW